jgi:hypothetical protein
VYRRRRAGEVVYLIDLKIDGIDNVVAYEFEILVLQERGDIGFTSGKKVVEADNLLAFGKQPFTEVGAYKARSAGYKYPVHSVAPSGYVDNTIYKILIDELRRYHIKAGMTSAERRWREGKKERRYFRGKTVIYEEKGL